MSIVHKIFDGQGKPTPNPANPVVPCIECGTEVQGVSAMVKVDEAEGGETYSVFVFECPYDVGYYWYTKADEIE